MSRRRDARFSATGVSVAFFALAPCLVAGLVPWLLTGWEAGPLLPVWLRLGGGLFALLGAIALVDSFVRFVFEGLGTPAPVAPTEVLVVGGLYRYVRNPMYLAVVATILGQGLLLSRPVLLSYGLVVALAMTVFVKLYEEPKLQDQFGSEYEDYRSSVPGWLPRLRPWSPRGGS